MSLSYDERREVRLNGWEYLVDDEERTAWISHARIGRIRRLRIPTRVTIDGLEYKIESVEMGAFKHTKTLHHLVIPDGITYVDEYNFSSSNLRSIYIGKDLDWTNSWIFHSNAKLRSFVISPDNPHLRGENGIVYSKDGKIVLCQIFHPRILSIKDGVEIVDNIAFNDNPRLQEVHFPSSLRKIGDNGFSDCPNLKRVILPEGFEECIVQCFMNDDNLEYVDLPSTMKDLQSETFDGCPKLNTMIIRTDHVLPFSSFLMQEKLDFAPHCDLYVPDHLVDAYRQHPLWKTCRNIFGINQLKKIK